MNKSINDMDRKELQKLSKSYSDLYFYLKGEIIFVDANRDGVIITVDFCSPSPRKLKFTKRMISGSLIILTDNNYENYLLTTVYFNPYIDKRLNQNKRQILIIEYNYLWLVLVRNLSYLLYKIGRIYKYSNQKHILSHMCML